MFMTRTICAYMYVYKKIACSICRSINGATVRVKHAIPYGTHVSEKQGRNAVWPLLATQSSSSRESSLSRDSRQQSLDDSTCNSDENRNSSSSRSHSPSGSSTDDDVTSNDQCDGEGSQVASSFSDSDQSSSCDFCSSPKEPLKATKSNTGGSICIVGRSIAREKNLFANSTVCRKSPCGEVKFCPAHPEPQARISPVNYLDKQPRTMRNTTQFMTSHNFGAQNSGDVKNSCLSYAYEIHAAEPKIYHCVHTPEDECQQRPEDVERPRLVSRDFKPNSNLHVTASNCGSRPADGPYTSRSSSSR